MRCSLKRFAVGVLVGAAACTGLLVWELMRDYGPTFIHRKGKLVATDRRLVATTTKSSVYDLTLQSDTGPRVDARMRVPAREGKLPGVLLTVGLGTGKRVIDLIEERDDMVLLAVDYDWGEQFDVTTARKLCQTLWTMRVTSAESVPHALLGLEFLAGEPNVDANRIAVVGVSYGTYIALPAAVLEPRVGRLILVQGGGDIGATIAANAPVWKSSVSPRLAGWLGDVVFRPFQPRRWIGRVAPRQVTFIASRTDPTLPVAAIEAVYAQAGEPKELVWHDTPHVGPDAANIIAELSRVVIEELGKQPPSR